MAANRSNSSDVREKPRFLFNLSIKFIFKMSNHLS